jgi:hypothetical protein
MDPHELVPVVHDGDENLARRNAADGGHDLLRVLAEDRRDHDRAPRPLLGLM